MTRELPEDQSWINRLEAALEHPAWELADRNTWQLEYDPVQIYAALLAAEPETGQFVLPGDIGVYVPESYEPNYAYPLIVWLSGPGRSEAELLALTPDISPQNYLALSLPRHLLPMDAALVAGVSAERDAGRWAAFEDELISRIERFREDYHVHSERIFLAGFDAAGSLALSTFLHRPEWFGGVMVFGSRMPRPDKLLTRYHELRGKRVLFGMGMHDSPASLTSAARTAQILHSAGMSVSTRIYDEIEPTATKMLGYINHWILDGVCEAKFV